ncbi:MAG: outer membrane lipoprotein-sorting protein [Deltaproteobacteria bacterium]|nr:MAG: outer membrane lipoprotein-sorting protein [Deltaproteobacteria bacterium]
MSIGNTSGWSSRVRRCAWRSGRRAEFGRHGSRLLLAVAALLLAGAGWAWAGEPAGVHVAGSAAAVGAGGGQDERLAAAAASSGPAEGSSADAGSSEVAESSSAAAPSLPTVAEVMGHMDRLYRADSSRARMRMEIVTSRFERTLEMETWTQGLDLALTVIRAPAREAGTATLRNTEGLWNYAPRADRLMRIPSGMMSDGWMGSHFTNDDMMRESSWEDDYVTELSWGEEGGQRVLRAESVPRPEAPVVWSRVVSVMSAEGWVPLRTEFWDGDTRRRTMTFSDVREVQGRRVPMRMELTPHDHPGERTVVIYERLEFNVDLDASLFTQRGLRREAQRR